MTGRAMGRHLINLYSNGVCKVLKIDDIEQLRRETLMKTQSSKDSMADIGLLMVTTFEKWLSPILIACSYSKSYRRFCDHVGKSSSQNTTEKDG